MHSIVFMRAFCLLTVSLALFANDIKILFTSALIETKFEERKEEYIKSLKILDLYEWKDKTYIIEAGPETHRSFFPPYAKHIFYANTNNPLIRNKGVNESTSLIKALKFLHFDENAMILKMTGRYFFNSDKLLKTIENHPEIDAFIKCDVWGQVFTGCYALRCKYMVEFYNQLDLQKMESEFINVEREAANFINKLEAENKIKVLRLDHLDVTANIFGFGTPDLTFW